MNIRLPAQTVLRAYIARGMRLWLIVRLAVVTVPVLVQMATPGDVLRYDASVSLMVLILCALLGFVDTRMRRERALLANLGVTNAEIAAMFAVPAAAGEILLARVMPW